MPWVVAELCVIATHSFVCVCVCVCWAYSEPSELAGCFWPPEDRSPESESPPSTLPSAAARNRHRTTSYAGRKTITIQELQVYRKKQVLEQTQHTL